MNEENEISQQMKDLLKVLLTEDNLIQIPDDEMEAETNENSFDSDLIKGYNDIGLVELWLFVFCYFFFVLMGDFSIQICYYFSR